MWKEWLGRTISNIETDTYKQYWHFETFCIRLVNILTNYNSKVMYVLQETIYGNHDTALYGVKLQICDNICFSVLVFLRVWRSAKQICSKKSSQLVLVAKIGFDTEDVQSSPVHFRYLQFLKKDPIPSFLPRTISLCGQRETWNSVRPRTGPSKFARRDSNMLART